MKQNAKSMRNGSPYARSQALTKIGQDNLRWIRSRIIAIDAKFVMLSEGFKRVAEKLSNFTWHWSSKNEEPTQPLDYETMRGISTKKAIEGSQTGGCDQR